MPKKVEVEERDDGTKVVRYGIIEVVLTPEHVTVRERGVKIFRRRTELHPEVARG